MTELDNLRRQIRDHAHHLVAPVPVQISRDDGTIDETWTPGLLAQLTAEIMASTGGTTRGRRGTPIPISPDAIDLHREIATRLGVNPADLHRCIAALPDVADSVKRVDWLEITVDALTWAIHAIDNLLDPPRRLEAVASCPACAARTVYRQDSAGETVRSAALVITPEGCTCQNCKTHWPPERLEHLARVLGCQPLPA